MVAVTPCPGGVKKGHFFAANRQAHAISPPPAASRPVWMQIYAGVAELVDALDLGSSDESCGGSSPSARTKRSTQAFARGLPKDLFLMGDAPLEEPGLTNHRRKATCLLRQID